MDPDPPTLHCVFSCRRKGHAKHLWTQTHTLRLGSSGGREAAGGRAALAGPSLFTGPSARLPRAHTHSPGQPESKMSICTLVGGEGELALLYPPSQCGCSVSSSGRGSPGSTMMALAPWSCPVEAGAQRGALGMSYTCRTCCAQVEREVIVRHPGAKRNLWLSRAGSVTHAPPAVLAGLQAQAESVGRTEKRWLRSAEFPVSPNPNHGWAKGHPCSGILRQAPLCGRHRLDPALQIGRAFPAPPLLPRPGTWLLASQCISLQELLRLLILFLFA